MDECPNGCDLRGAPIPEDQREHFGEHTHFSRKISVYSRERDRTTHWRCPDCDVTWDRR